MEINFSYNPNAQYLEKKRTKYALNINTVWICEKLRNDTEWTQNTEVSVIDLNKNDWLRGFHHL